VHGCEAHGELLLPALGLGYCTLLLGVITWGLTLLDSGAVAGTGLGYWTSPSWMPSSLVWQYWTGWLGCGSLVEEPCVTVIWSLQKLPGAVCEERNSNRAF